MANWPAIGILSGAELTVFFGATARSFTAQARLIRERDDDITAAVSGFEAGEVVPTLEILIDEVERLRGPGPALVALMDEVERLLGPAPDLGEKIEEVERLRGPGETLGDTLNRADVAQMFRAAVQASIRSQTPRLREKALVHRYTALGFLLLIAQVAAPVALYNVLTEGYNLPDTVMLIAATSFSFSAVAAAVAGVLVAVGELALARVIREGKNAAA